MKKIFISGFLGSGKATLLFLLDGHPNILCNVIHDKFINCLIGLEKLCKTSIDNYYDKKQSNKSSKNKIIFSRRLNKKTNISIVDIREALHNTGLYNLERYSLVKKYPNFFSSAKREYLNFNFDYEKFEKGWKTEIFENKKGKYEYYLEEIYDIFYKNFFNSWDDLNNLDFEKKYYASKLPNDIQSVEYVLKENIDAKILYVDRSTIGLVKTKTLTHMKLHNLSIDKFNENFYATSKSKFVDKVCDEKKRIKELKKRYPDKIFLSSLENIVSNTKKELKDILNFCNLEYNECVNYPSYCLKKFEQAHLEKINDDEYELNSKNNFFIRLRANDKKNIKFGQYLIYLKEYIMYLYLKMKKIVK